MVKNTNESVEGGIDVQLNENVAVIKFFNPKKLNCLTMEMLKQMDLLLKSEEVKDKCLIITGGTERAFCSGADIKTLSLQGVEDALFFHHLEVKVYKCLYRYPMNTITVWNGYCMGAGVGMGIHSKCRLAIAESDNDSDTAYPTVWAMPETGIGFYVDCGLMYYLTRVEGNIGLLVGLTGMSLGPAELYQFKLVDSIIPSNRINEVISHITEMADEYKNDSALLLESIKKYAAGMHINIKSNHVLTRKETVELMKRYDLTAPCTADLLKYLESDSLYPSVSREIASIIRKNCPTSCDTWMQQYIWAKQGISLDDVLDAESKIITYVVKENRHNFVEGVRAKLIDKDNTPNWIPSEFEKISLPNLFE